MENNYLDPDDIRCRGQIKQHPMFYWCMIYDAPSDKFRILPFMRINNGDSARADWMDVAVTEKHRIRNKEAWQRFITEQSPKRTEFTRAEMMHIQLLRDKYEYNKGLCLLPTDNPMYEKLISNFSIKLRAEDIAVLNRMSDTEEQMDAPDPEKPDTRSQSQKILDVLSLMADRMDDLAQRVKDLENK